MDYLNMLVKYRYMINILLNMNFFLQIAQSFSFMKELTIINRKLQNDNQDLSIIEYPYLN